MKILFIVDGLGAGGAGRVVSRLANALIARDYEVGILTVFSAKINYDLDPNIWVESMVNDGTPKIKGMIGRVRIIRELCKQKKIDVVVSFLTEINVYAIIAGFGQKWVTIISERNNPFTEPKDKRVRMLRSLLYRFSDGYVFQTEDARRYFSKKIQHRGIVIANPITDDIVPPFLGKRTKRIVAVGRLVKQKNYPMAIAAFEKAASLLPEYTFEIYGEGPERADLERLVEKCGMEKRILFMGHRKEVLSEIRDASLYIMSSDYEGMPNALMEAMAIGLPVISTNHPIGGAAMLITNDENGVLVHVNCAEELSKSMIEVLSNEEKCKKLSANAVLVKQRYAIHVICAEWENYIRDLCERKKGKK